MCKFSKKSHEQLKTCHSDLKLIAFAVLQLHDCSVIQGQRDKETQDEYFRKGTSSVEFPNSKHNSTPSMAIDLAPYKKGDNPYDMENVLYFAGIVMTVAAMLYKQRLVSYKLKWGGTWDTKLDATFAFDRNGFYDGIHFELVTD